MPFVAIGAPDGPYGLTDLLDMPFIAMAQGTSVRALPDSACLRLGHTLLPRFEVAHLATAGAFVAQGLGITVLPELTLAVPRTDRLPRPKIGDFGLQRGIGLVRPPVRPSWISSPRHLGEAERQAGAGLYRVDRAVARGARRGNSPAMTLAAFGRRFPCGPPVSALLFTASTGPARSRGKPAPARAP
ncbi:LysR substrate-binding domain-containing protein [Primorskyibacter sp. 2E107]|uniref:LysR substrate-binding domain-containing protein n=1 Tax=Primorskyibacter sp. 2E107 TaxID=3403458 RepID=UPI003AF83A7A